MNTMTLLHRALGLAVCTAIASSAYGQSSLPAYTPDTRVVGEIRNYGFGFGGLLPIWEAGFRKYHPGVAFKDVTITSDAAFPALVTGMTDLAPDGGEPAITEWLSFYETYGYHATDVVVASGTYDVDGRSPGVVVYVHPDNPVSGLTLRQLDGIFGAERTGGLDNFKWDIKRARGPEGNIRTWGQLGLKGEWADKPIQTYGHAPSGTTRFFQLRVLANSAKWNPNYREYVETGSKMIADYDREAQRGSLGTMLRELANDRCGIAWTVVPQVAQVAGVKLKPLALAAEESGPYVQPSKATFQDRSYPLVRNLYFYVNRKPGTAMDPKQREFLRYVLSREGQDAIVAQGNYLPLPEAMVRESLAKLDGGKPVGAVRVWGHGSRSRDFIGSLIGAWSAGSKQRDPALSIEASLKGDKSAIGGLYTGAADVAIMERDLSAIEKDSYEQLFGRTDPFAVTIATGSLDRPDHAMAPAIFVHRDNPLQKLTLAQLDAIIGADRRRGASAIRTWGDLGITGELASRPIHVYGFAIEDDVLQYLQKAVMGGSQKWTGNLSELGKSRDAESGRRILDALRKDRSGLAISFMAYQGGGVKPIALGAGQDFLLPTIENVSARRYPLTRSLVAYANREPGKALDPRVREFLEYVLSPDGQRDIEREGGYFPLPPGVAASELEKLK